MVVSKKLSSKKPAAKPVAKRAAAPKAPAPKTSVPVNADALLTATISKPNERQGRVRRGKAKEGNLKMRKHLWPGLDESRLWLHKDRSRVGYTTMPRTVPLFINLINDISKRVTTNGKAVPAGKTYLVLWCRVFEEGFLKIDSEAAAALEAGYGSERNISTWREHLIVLKALGFIDCKEGPAGPFQYILIFNPYQVVKALHAKGWVQEGTYTALFQRAIDIGATDLVED